MPIFASLFSAVSGAFAALLSAIVARDVALKGAAYGAYLTITGTFLVTTFVCIQSLWSMVMAFFAGSGSMATVSGAMAIALGMLIPGNAATVLACCASVWAATQVYKVQKTGVFIISR